ncbi:MAG: hypothetical protein K2Z25_25835 [Beijerinckiaceae bacterium]|nr:hypothetical protein [Beijerinckiaceae bacterium]
MPVRTACREDCAFIHYLETTLAAEGGEYPYVEARFASLLKKRLTQTEAVRRDDLAEEADWNTQFYIMESKTGVRAGFAVTSNWVSPDELSQKADLTPRDVRLWVVGVQDKFRGRGLGQDVIQHIIDERHQINEPGSVSGVYYTKLAAKIAKSSVRSSDLLENYFDFDPQYSPSATHILTRAIWRYD